jgi:hypothetical protein
MSDFSSMDQLAADVGSTGFFGTSRRETTELALSGTTAFLIRAEQSRVETRVLSVGADDEKRERSYPTGEYVRRIVDRNLVRHVGRPPNPCCLGQVISAGLSGLVRRDHGSISWG